MATSDSLIEVTAGRIRVHLHSDASQLSVAVRSPVTARLSYDTGGWNTIGNPWNLIVNGAPSGVLEYSDNDARFILNADLDNKLVAGKNKVELVGAVWPQSKGGLLLLSGGNVIVVNAEYTWSGSAQHNIIHQTWTLDFSA